MKLSNKSQTETSPIDVLLQPFLEANTPEEEEERLTHLINEHINPLVKQILRHKLQIYVNHRKENYRNPDLEEVQQEVQLQLLKRMFDLKTHPVRNPMVNLRSYVAATARNACDEYMRRKSPQRRQLRDHIRYCLLSHQDLALWEETSQGWLTGLSIWNSIEGLLPERDTMEVQQDLHQLLIERVDEVDARHLTLYNLITKILEIAGAPVGVDQLTTVIAKTYGIQDYPVTSFDGDPAGLRERLPSLQANPDELVEYREHLGSLWTEICQLPRRQRVALLCNLKNPQGVNVITLFPATRVASFEQIADALEIPQREFEVLWSKLPLDDLSLAQYLGISRQQVINLRRNARDRLSRRMKALEKRQMQATAGARN
ncbi:MAG TPA: hypothetical protein VGN86_09295 [Pyrinomonadaceae bacterium]|jgi:RNA polymerase sigma factor (sigma-70 family)|nr:hypothetical protein [Pyrinomonadaceae bacterium]